MGQCHRGSKVTGVGDWGLFGQQEAEEVSGLGGWGSVASGAAY